MKKIIYAILLFSLFLSACTPVIITPSPQDIQTAIAATLENKIPPSATASPSNTPTKVPPTNTQQPSATFTPSGPYDAIINAAYLNLRTGPGTFFEVEKTYVEENTLLAISRTADNEWVYVETEDDLSGWMSTSYLSFSNDPSLLPIANIEDMTVIQGRVEDSDGNPISGINIAIINREGSQELRTDAYSDSQGEWMAIIPNEDIYTLLDIQIVGVRCDSSIMNENCDIENYYEVLGRNFLNLPTNEIVVFTYAVSTKHITGLIIDKAGDPAADILVVAERDDGAESSVYSNEDGSFSIAADAGVWEVYTVNFDNGRSESEHVQLEITDEDPAPIELSTP